MVPLPTLLLVDYSLTPKHRTAHSYCFRGSECSWPLWPGSWESPGLEGIWRAVAGGWGHGRGKKVWWVFLGDWHDPGSPQSCVRLTRGSLRWKSTRLPSSPCSLVFLQGVGPASRSSGLPNITFRYDSKWLGCRGREPFRGSEASIVVLN